MLPVSETTSSLNRIYLEVTNCCNLECRICIRNTWAVLPGRLSIKLYGKILEDIQQLNPIPEIFFGGYGEPLIHPDIIKMIQDARKIGAKTTLITNGTLLSAETSKALISAGLNRLWVSLDGAHSESYHHINQGENQPNILRNLKRFQEINKSTESTPQGFGDTELGIVIVVLKKNAANLQDMVEQGIKLGANSFFFTYLEAYSGEMAKEALYPVGISRPQTGRALKKSEFPTPESALNDTLADIKRKSLENGNEIKLAGSFVDQDPPVCSFVDQRAVVVRWDGEVSPCLPLLYSHISILGSWKREVKSFSLGNIESSSILNIWHSPGYVELRDRLLDNRFSPCINCQDCWLSEDNLLDCMGYEHPTCGGCLWSSGLIQCP